MTCTDPPNSSVSLDVAMEVCREHGITFQAQRRCPQRPRPQRRPRRRRQSQRRLRRRWRVRFLEELRVHRKRARTIGLLGLSTSTVYKEIAVEPSFAQAVEMATGREPWDEQLWCRALERAREKEAEIVDLDEPGGSTDTSRSGPPR